MEEKNITTSKVLDAVLSPASTDFAIQVTGYNGANGNVKVRGSMIEGVDFTQPSSEENPWAYINLSSNTQQVNKSGSEGIDITSDSTEIIELNVNVITAYAVELTVSAGTFDVTIINTDNR